jgi:hypothetical protein
LGHFLSHFSHRQYSSGDHFSDPFYVDHDMHQLRIISVPLL